MIKIFGLRFSHVPLALLVATLGLPSCGLQRQINELKNREAQAEAATAARDAELAELAERDEQLQTQIDALKVRYEDLSSQLISMDAAFAESNLTLSEQAMEIQQTVTAMQVQQNAILITLATLQGYTNIVSIYNPCGVQNAYDEVLLKLSNGTYLASFSQNGSALTTRFVVLSDGDYVTTDGAGNLSNNCHFTISNNGTVISDEHN